MLSMSLLNCVVLNIILGTQFTPLLFQNKIHHDDLRFLHVYGIVLFPSQLHGK